jgi:two-component system chemotaxis sensor kinase CheA
MDISEYLPMFLAEGREHLQELNLAVVRIEGVPTIRRPSTRFSASRTR